MIKIIKLKNDKLDNIKGGALTIWTITGITALVIFISGIIKGITNPEGCGE